MSDSDAGTKPTSPAASRQQGVAVHRITFASPSSVAACSKNSRLGLVERWLQLAVQTPQPPVARQANRKIAATERTHLPTGSRVAAGGIGVSSPGDGRPALRRPTEVARNVARLVVPVMVAGQRQDWGIAHRSDLAVTVIGQHLAGSGEGAVQL